MVYYAHISEDGQREQTVFEHLSGVAEYAGEFAAVFGWEETAKLAGMLHDIGKYSSEFQKHLLSGGPRVDHSTAGAQEIKRCLKLTPYHYAAQYCIAGHHAGLPDGGTRADTKEEATLTGRLKKEGLPGYRDYQAEVRPEDWDEKKLKPFEPQHSGRLGFTFAFYIRMLYSCLVDGDFLDTEKFMSDGAVNRASERTIKDLYTLFQAHIEKFRSPVQELNRTRTRILEQCLEKGRGRKGLYSLTVPTGGGKTLASVGFALEQAKANSMRRIIYVIPYTSIIEQTAEVFCGIFGPEAVLEHHSSVSFDEEEELSRQQKLASENWAYPLVVTTNVQFFESLFANKSSKCRKLHNIADSVIIFDEAQMIPLPYLLPCLTAVTELVNNFGCTAVLCSATQPALQTLLPKQMKIEEINQGGKEAEAVFRRVSFRFVGGKTDAELCEELKDQNQILCIVNTRRHARELFGRLPENGRYCLTTLLRPADRQRLLKEIRQRLEQGEVCRVVSTSLIEAGVDVDFPAVYRAQAGLDSMIQAGGRCNREGRKGAEESIVSIFVPEEKYLKACPQFVRQLIQVSQAVLDHCPDIMSKEANDAYFQMLYQARGEENLDEKAILKQFEQGLRTWSFPFASAAKKFKLIDEDTIPVLIPIEKESEAAAESLRYGKGGITAFREAARYSVHVYRYQYLELIRSKAAQALADGGIAVLTDTELYDRETGLKTVPETGAGIFI